MLSISILIISALCVEICTADNFYEKTFEKTSGPYFVSKESVNWTDAKIGCKQADLELASVISEEEQAALKIFIRENSLIPADKWSGYWLSGVRHEDGKYYWDSTGTEVSSFDGWARGEPSHAYGREDCVELKWDVVDLGWNDYFCDETRRYICQVPRKVKPKAVKTKLQKVQIQKEWQQKDNIDDDSRKPVETKETENS